MGSTNFTPNYNLPQFIGTDKPAWLTDVNTAFSNIDTAIKNAADDASSAVSTAGSASSAAASAVNSVGTLNTQINTPGTGLAAQVTSQGTSIASINNKIGTTPLTTVAQTLTGAIEEVKNSVPASTGLMVYEGTFTASYSYDGNTAMTTGMAAVYSDIVTAYANLAADEYIRIISLRPNSVISCAPDNLRLLNTVPSRLLGHTISESSGTAILFMSEFSSTPHYRVGVGTFSLNDEVTTTPAAGVTSTIIYEKYKVLA